MHQLHIVCGAAGVGKTTFAKSLAEKLPAFLLDSDLVTERVVQAGLALAGLDVDDRDSPQYKNAYRSAVYDTLYDLAAVNLPYGNVIIAAPFTTECQTADWQNVLEKRIGTKPKIWHLTCADDVRKKRIAARGVARDAAKLADWENYSIPITPQCECEIVQTNLSDHDANTQK